MASLSLKNVVKRYGACKSAAAPRQGISADFGSEPGGIAGIRPGRLHGFDASTGSRL